MMYKEGDVIGTVTLVVDEVYELGFSVVCRELPDHDMYELLQEWQDEVDLMEVQAKLDPKVRKRMLLEQREKIDKQLEEME